MPREKPDQQHLHAAHGYIQLEMFEEANDELEEIDSFCRHLPEVLMARVAIYGALEKWELMAIVAKKLVEWNPSEPGNFILSRSNNADCQWLPHTRPESLDIRFGA